MTEPAVVTRDWTTICDTGQNGNGNQVVVEPEAVIGGFAVHLRIRYGSASGPGYTVTHRTTGRAVWHVPQFNDAVRVATWLDLERVIPEGREETLQWRAMLTPSARTLLVAKLQDIAPRLVPE